MILQASSFGPASSFLSDSHLELSISKCNRTSLNLWLEVASFSRSFLAWRINIKSFKIRIIFNWSSSFTNIERYQPTGIYLCLSLIIILGFPPPVFLYCCPDLSVSVRKTNQFKFLSYGSLTHLAWSKANKPRAAGVVLVVDAEVLDLLLRSSAPHHGFVIPWLGCFFSSSLHLQARTSLPISSLTEI